MRIALLTAQAEIPGKPGQRLAFRRFVGRTVLSHQVDCALELGCDTIICLVSGVGQDVLASQRRVEDAGSRFHLIDGPMRMLAMVKADDDLFVFADGLLPDPEIVTTSLDKRPGVLAFPADPAVSRGFQRIDATRAWAGVMRIRGDRVERLSQLPEDADPAAGLLRIALQAGARTVSLDTAMIFEGRWQVEPETASLADHERQWIARQGQPVSFTAPGLAVAERMGVRFAKDVIGTRLEVAPLLAAVIFGIAAGISALLGHPVVGLALALPMAFALPVTAVVERVSRVGSRMRRKLPLTDTLRGAADLLIASLIALASPQGDGWLRLFVPLMLIGLARLGEHRGPARLRPTYADRIALLAILVPAAMMGAVQPVAAVLGLLALAGLFLSDITRD